MAANSKANEELRQRNKSSFSQAALYWNQLANDRVFEISKQLLGIALIILPLTGSIVLAKLKLSQFQIDLLTYGWFFLFVSIICGFINFWIEATYFQYLSNDSSTREKIWSDTNRSVAEMEKDTVKLGSTKPTSSFIPLGIQTVSLVLGVIFIMIVVRSLLYQPIVDSPSKENTNNTYQKENICVYNLNYLIGNTCTNKNNPYTFCRQHINESCR